MSRSIDVYLESAPKRTFAVALDWPGWARSGKTDEEALAVLATYGSRYKKTLPSAGRELSPPSDASGFHVTERVEGGSGTEFGVPSASVPADARPVTDDELRRLVSLLRAAWRAFDRAAEAAEGVELRKGPRGGGRDLAKIREHVLEAEEAYVSEAGGTYDRIKADIADRMSAARDAMIATLGSSARGEELRPMVRRTRPYWTVRYCVRRSAWHALDHAWEIEDRAAPEPA